MARSSRSSVLQSYHDTARVEGAGWRVHCPYCVSSKTGRPDHSISVTHSGLYYCFRCGCRGRLRGPEFVADGLSVQHMTEDDLRLAVASSSSMPPPDGYTELWCGEGAGAMVFSRARAYAESRGLNAAKAEEYQAGAVLEGTWHGRIILPVTHPDDPTAWVGYVGRDFTKRSPLPYRYPKGMPRGKYLFNQRVLSGWASEPVLVVEGVLDTVPYSPNAVAVLGKPSEHHRAALARSLRPVAIVLDGDAWDDAWALAMELRFAGVRAGAVRLPPKVDPDEVDAQWLWREAERSLDAVL